MQWTGVYSVYLLQIMLYDAEFPCELDVMMIFT